MGAREMSKEYRVEIDDDGCSSCHQGQTFGIVTPEAVETFIGHSFGEEVEAQEWCGVLNQAYQLGQARLAPIREVYDGYKPVDDRFELGSDEFCREALKHLWQAIRRAMEEQG